MVEDFAIVALDDLGWIKRYIIGAGEGVIIQVGEEDAFFDVLESVGEDDEIEHLVIFGEGDDFEEAGLISHKLSMFGPVGFEVGII